jgi:23S rRNA pseudouridine2605 synthase
MLHKPRGYLVSAKDPNGRRTVYDLLRDAPRGLRYVGRLDWESEGLLLLTTDGELAHRLTHPRYEVWKTYLAEVNGSPSDEALERLRHGIPLDDGEAAPARVERLQDARVPRGHSLLRVGIREGKNREVRRMLAAVGHEVTRLIRIEVGGVRLGELPPGASRPLTAAEAARLRTLVGLVDATEDASL